MADQEPQKGDKGTSFRSSRSPTRCASRLVAFSVSAAQKADTSRPRHRTLPQCLSPRAGQCTHPKLTRHTTVSWSWGNGQPEGKVAEVAKEGEIAIQSNRGNTIKKNADPEDPAVHIERPGNDVVKRASELEIEEKKNGSSEQKADDPSEKENGSAGKKADEKAEANGAESKDTEKKDAANGHQNGNSEKEEKAEDKEQAKKSDDEAQTGDKRKADAVDEKKDEDVDEEEGNEDNEEGTFDLSVRKQCGIY